MRPVGADACRGGGDAVTERKALAALVKAITCDLTASNMADCPLIRIALRDAERVLAGEPTTARGLRNRARKSTGGTEAKP